MKRTVADKRTTNKSFDNSKDIVSLYFDEMGSIATLSRDEELHITRRIDELSKLMLLRLSLIPYVVENVMNLYEECVQEKRRWDDIFKARDVFREGQWRKISGRDRRVQADQIYHALNCINLLADRDVPEGTGGDEYLRQAFHRNRISQWIRELDPTADTLLVLKDNFLSAFRTSDPAIRHCALTRVGFSENLKE